MEQPADIQGQIQQVQRLFLTSKTESIKMAMCGLDDEERLLELKRQVLDQRLCNIQKQRVRLIQESNQISEYATRLGDGGVGGMMTTVDTASTSFLSNKGLTPAVTTKLASSLLPPQQATTTHSLKDKTVDPVFVATTGLEEQQLAPTDSRLYRKGIQHAKLEAADATAAGGTRKIGTGKGGLKKCNKVKRNDNSAIHKLNVSIPDPVEVRRLENLHQETLTQMDWRVPFTPPIASPRKKQKFM